MHPTLRRFAPALPVHLLFLTRSSCAICTNTKPVLARAWKRRPYEYTEVDVMTDEGKEYRAYEFDVPVVRVSRVVGGEHGSAVVGEKVREMMHRIDEDEVVQVLEQVGGVGSAGEIS